MQRQSSARSQFSIPPASISGHFLKNCANALGRDKTTNPISLSRRSTTHVGISSTSLSAL